MSGIGSILKLDSSIDRVVVGSHVLKALVVVELQIPSWPIVQDAFLHFKAVTIRPKSLVVIKIVNSKIDNNLVSLKSDWWQAVKIHVNFNNLQILVNADMNNSSFIRSIDHFWRLKVESHL